MTRKGVFTLLALLLTVLPAAAAGGILKRGESGAVFSKICDISARFGMGLVRAGDGWATVDRHRDEIVILDVDGKEKGTLGYPAYEPSDLSRVGDLLAAADREQGKIYLIDPESGICRRILESPATPIEAIAGDLQGNLWIAAKGAENLQLIDGKDGTTLREIPAPSRHITAMGCDGKGHLWTADRIRDSISMVDLEHGLTIFSLGTPCPYPSGLFLEGASLFLLDYEEDAIFSCRVEELAGLRLRSDERKGSVSLYADLHQLGPGEIVGGRLLMALPEDGPNQQVEELSYPDGGSILTDRWGQKVVTYDIGKLGAGESFFREMKVRGRFYAFSTIIFPERVGGLGEIPEEVAKAYLVDEDKYRITDPYITARVREIVGGEENPYFIARKLYEFLITRISYEMIGGWDIAPTVIRRGTGSCSEYTFAYIALCRAAGIPARYVGAMVLRGDDASIDRAFHRWAEIYLPRIGWIPVDVNAGDDPLPADRAASFGGIANRFLISTRGGGNSDLLGWDYNLRTEFESSGKANFEVESFAEWDRD